jgi:hypothetical protein
MLSDVSWLAEQARTVHAIFFSWFFPLVTIFLLVGVIIDFFKLPLGGTPAFGTLLGRTIIACLLLYAYPEISNAFADVVDAVANQLGSLNDFNLVLAKMGDKLQNLTWSWMSFKDSIIGILSYLSFFLLYISVYAVQAFMMFSWTILFVFSPVMIALFVLPATAGATSSLFRSLIEVGMWKVVWSVLATLLWSFALSDINNGADVNFLTAIFLNLILAGSLLLTPIIVGALAGKGISSLASTAGGIVAGATMSAPFALANSVKSKAVGSIRSVSNLGGGMINRAQAARDWAANRKNPSRSNTKSKNQKGGL